MSLQKPLTGAIEQHFAVNKQPFQCINIMHTLCNTFQINNLPKYNDFLPMASKHEKQSSKSFLSPDASIVSCPSRAGTLLPTTGASKYTPPRACIA
jgi:hypothetical protein